MDVFAFFRKMIFSALRTAGGRLASGHFPAGTGLVAALCAGMFAPEARAAWETGMPEPATAMAAAQRDLNILMMWIIVVIGVGVFGAMFYAIVKHRKSAGHEAAQFHENTLAEILWTAAPMVIIVLMALPATAVILDYKNTSEPDMTVKVTGYQWKWSYDYLDEGVFFYSQLSTPPEQIGGRFYRGAETDAAREENANYLLEVDNEMVVPVGRKVRLLFTAADVIHAWWVPQLGVKQDAIPGMVRDGWFRAERTGIFRGQCAELCGKNHGFMPIVVRVVEEDEYASWLQTRGGKTAAEREAEAVPAYAGDVVATGTAEGSDAGSEDGSGGVGVGEWTMEVAMERGKSAYATHCAACHQLNGAGLPPTFPALAGTEMSTTGPVSEHLEIVLKGKAGTAMAAFGYLSDADIAAIVTYERNAWGNDTGDLVTPEDVQGGR